jgi:hypothetical protein
MIYWPSTKFSLYPHSGSRPPLVVPEAQAAGLFVPGSRLGGIAGIVGERDGGWLVLFRVLHCRPGCPNIPFKTQCAILPSIPYLEEAGQ